MRIVFMGTPQFAVDSLKKLLHCNYNIIAVVTAPDKPQGRGLKVVPSPVKQAALEANLPVLQPQLLKDIGFIAELKALRPDLILVVAFRILPEEVFGIPPLGTINLHGSLLPRYRGAAPINWAIIKGEKISGATTFFIRKEVDTGTIIDAVEVEIGPNMTAGELHDILAIKGADLLVRTCDRLVKGTIRTRKQDESLATKAPKIFKEDCLINFDQSVAAVHNFIRGLSPLPAAYTLQEGKKTRLFQTGIYSENNVQKSPGSIVEIKKDELIIQCNPGLLAVREIQPEGKRRMKIEEYLRGHTLQKLFFA
jgi:methionyl-tRNA formyltransferase